MAALLALKGTVNYIDFEMGINMPYDDLVFKYRTSETTLTTNFIQFKHQARYKVVTFDEFVSLKGNFSLVKNFLEYQKIMNSPSTTAILENTEIVNFVLYSNRKRNKDLSFLKKYDDPELKIFNVSNRRSIFKIIPSKLVKEYKTIFDFVSQNVSIDGLKFRIKNSKELSKGHSQYLQNLCSTHKNNFIEIFHTIKNQLEYFVKPEFDTFLNKFVLILYQGDQNIVETLVRKEIEKHFNGISNLLPITINFLRYVSTWTTGQIHKHFTLTNTVIANKLVDLLLEPYILPYGDASKLYETVLERGLWQNILKDQSITLIQKDEVTEGFLKNYVNYELSNICNVDINAVQHIKAWTTILSADDKNRIISHLKQTHLDIFEMLVSYEDIRDDITFLDVYRAMHKMGKICLVLEANTVAICETILSILEKTKCESPVIVMTNDSVCNLPQRVCSSLMNLNDVQKMHVLNENAIFQGKLTKLEKLVSAALFSKISIKDVILIIVGKYFIGNKPNPLTKFYVTQTLNRIIIDPQALNKCAKDIFIILCSDQNSFKEYLKRNEVNTEALKYCNFSTGVQKYANILLSQEDCFEHVLNNYSDCPVHELYLHENEMILELIRTERGVANLRTEPKNLDTVLNHGCKLIIKSKDLVANLKNKITIISSGPGMGKSTLLDFLWHEIPSDFWVLYVDLKLHLDYYVSQQFETNMADPQKHLIYFNNEIISKTASNLDVSNLVFKNLLDCKRVYVFLDGFDEVPTASERNVTNLIMSLYNNCYRTILTTRPVMQTHVENHFHMLSINLNPFSNLEQTEFLNKYFLQDLTDVNNWDKNRISCFVDCLRHLMSTNLNDFDNKFMGVPLQCRMLAEIFSNDCRNFVLTGKLELQENFDLLSLYESFVRGKLDILNLKYGPFSKDFNIFIEKYQKFYALKIIFPTFIKDSIVEIKLSNFKEFIEDLEKNIQKDGILSVNEELNINFVHRTIAEYFAAKWLSENYKSTEFKELAQSLIKIIFEKNYNVVRIIFDRILAKGRVLHEAIINNKPYDEIADIIRSNPKIMNETDDGKRTPLHLAASWGEKHPYKGIIPIFECLDDDDNFHFSVTDKMTDISILLLENGASSNRDTILGYNAVDYAILNNSAHVLNFLATKFTETNININKYVHEYLSYFCAHRYNFLLRFIFNNISIDCNIQKFINEKYYCSVTPLFVACLMGDFDLVKMLISYNANTNDENGPNKKTCLGVAAFSGFTEIVKYLISAGANVNLCDGYGNTPLLLSCLHGCNTQIEQFLLEADFQRSRSDKEKRSDKYDLFYNLDIKCLERYFNVTENNKCFMDILKYLVSSGADINKGNIVGRTPLHIGSWMHQTEAAKYLIVHTDNINITDSFGNTPLHLACAKGNAETIQNLINHGANLNAVNRDQRTPMHIASCYNFTNTVKYLLAFKADFNIRDKWDRTPLHIATFKGYIKIIRLLLVHGAKIDDSHAASWTERVWTTLRVSCSKSYIQCRIKLSGFVPKTLKGSYSIIKEKESSSNKSYQKLARPRRFSAHK